MGIWFTAPDSKGQVTYRLKRVTHSVEAHVDGRE